EKRYADALDCLGRLRQQLEPGRYFSLRGHVAWMTAFIHFVIGDPAAAIPLYRQAESLFERGGEKENTDFMRTLLAESLTELGRRREAWQQIYRSLKTTPAGHDLGRLYSAFVVPANAALKQGQTAVALYFQQEVVRYAERSGDPMRLPGAYLTRGSIQAVLGHPEAQTDLQHARRALEGQTDATLRGLTQANLDRTEGEIVRDPRQAIALLSSALDFYERAQLHLLALQIYQARARAYLRAGDSEHAEEDLRSGLDAYERIGHFVSDKELQVAFVEEMEAVFDEAITFEIGQRRRADLAFNLADRARTHVLPAYASKITGDTPEKTRLLASEPSALKLEEIQERLPTGTALVEYAVVGDRIDIWLIRRNSWRWWQREVPRRELQKQVAALRTFRPDRAGRLRWSRTSAALYDLLVRPWAAAVAPGERLVLVPDKVLHALPFACLRQGPNGPYLIEAHPLTIAPSGTIFARALAQGSRQAHIESERRALVIGNPTFDPARSSFSQLGPLPEAEEEAKSVASQLGGATLLLGPEARKARFLALAPGTRILHFGGHAVVDESNPLLSALLLAPDPGDLGILYAREVYTMRLSGTELVVLAACSTGTDYLPGSEGVTSLGRAFLAAGARSVVASLWPVDDRTTRQLFQAFYRGLAAGDDPASALRAAQISLLRDPQEPAAAPSAWGAFEVIGAGTTLPTSLF
ncbi:MAG TPA: CHAT domain-containing protein, partial [Thermoanaerobaculia bacterium]|nr:CHAT domain-containing protein [Thermoanaerobaculia bacterium]